MKTPRPQHDVPLPDHLRGRPRDARGFIVPYFVAWRDDDGNLADEGRGEPDFRTVNTSRFVRCIKQRLCWLCGHPLGRHLSFVIGPMCTVTRTTSEPPSHLACADYALKVCPFLTRPAMRRLPMGADEAMPPAGLHLDRNPGVSALWTSREFTLFKTKHGNAGTLIQVGEPSRVEWWREGRWATRAEVQASMVSGLPSLREIADAEGNGAREELERFIERAERYLPAE
jgi:hypothetical protein